MHRWVTIAVGKKIAQASSSQGIAQATKVAEREAAASRRNTVPQKTPPCISAYRAYSTALISLITFTLISPGYFNSDWILFATAELPALLQDAG